MKVINEQSRPALARGVRLQKDATTGEPMLMYPEGVLYLSSTAHAIISRCNGQLNVAGIVLSLARDYEVDRETLRRDILHCLIDLHQRKLLVF